MDGITQGWASGNRLLGNEPGNEPGHRNRDDIFTKKDTPKLPPTLLILTALFGMTTMESSGQEDVVSLQNAKIKK